MQGAWVQSLVRKLQNSWKWNSECHKPVKASSCSPLEHFYHHGKFYWTMMPQIPHQFTDVVIEILRNKNKTHPNPNTGIKDKRLYGTQSLHQSFPSLDLNQILTPSLQREWMLNFFRMYHHSPRDKLFPPSSGPLHKLPEYRKEYKSTIFQ